PVIDARDVLTDPRRTLQLLCGAVGVEFDDRMLAWPTGLRDTDGVWAKYWYAEVARSTSFQNRPAPTEPVPAHLQEVYDRCGECYRELHQYRLH
ncbi:MAG: HAD family hydrolase, partial [Chthoniobacterales bacterium]